MGSSTGAGAAAAAAILFYCVALSVAAAADETPQDNSDFLSTAALACSNATTADASRRPSRKLIGVDGPVIAGKCPVRFEQMNWYNELAVECRGPQLAADRCCGAFKVYACPLSELLNNVSNGCADDMFYHISTQGNLPPGLFYENCREGPRGLKC